MRFIPLWGILIVPPPPRSVKKQHSPPRRCLGVGNRAGVAPSSWSVRGLCPVGEPGEVAQHGLCRWHTVDPIRFQRDLEVTIQALGWWLNAKFEPLTDGICSVGYWYQAEPHAPFVAMSDLARRWPR